MANFEDDWTYPHHNKKQTYIVELMSFKHGRIDDPCPRTTRFSKDQLLEVKPSDVKAYLNWKAYDDPFPSPNANPTSARAVSLKKAKSGISHHMVFQNVPWMNGRGGNPTRHHSVHAVIAGVLQKECRDLGVQANDKRGYTEEEHDKVLVMFRRCEDYEQRMIYPTMTVLSTHLIHRLDDTAHFKVTAIHGNMEFPFTLKAPTKWSKNVRSVRQCPDQHILASMDWKSCTILWYSLHLEQWLGMHPNVKFLFTTSVHDELGPRNVKTNYHNRAKIVVWNTEEFEELHDQTGDEAAKGLGTTSVRKCAATRANRMGATFPQIEHRGRWVGDRGRRVVSRHYVSPDDPYQDAFVAACLCKGGPIKYKLKEGIHVTDNFLYVECVPNIRRRFPNDNRMCRLLGLCTLWAAFDEDARDFMPTVDGERIRSNFYNTYGQVEGNPVKKVSLQVLQVNGRLDIVEVNHRPDGLGGVAAVATGGNNNGNDGGNNGDPAAPQVLQVAHSGHRGRADAEQLMAYLQQMERNFSTQLETVRGEMAAFRPWASNQFNTLNRNQIRFGGTIGQAMARGHPGRNQRNRLHQAASALQRQRLEAQRSSAAASAMNAHRTSRNAPSTSLTAESTTTARPSGRTAASAVEVDDDEEVQIVPRPTNVPQRSMRDPHAELVDKPRNLYELWEEYQFGIGDNKPAKDFTRDEINGHRTRKAFANKYCRRMKIWRVQNYLINRGLNIEAANNMIIDCYGSDKPTVIATMIQRSQNNPTHPYIGTQRFHPRMCRGNGFLVSP